MNIYIISISHILEQRDSCCYDCYMGHVIVAENKRQILAMVKNMSADEGRDIWEKAKIENLGEYKGTIKDNFVVLSDFNAG